jgi:hypothetical protein
MPRMRVEAGDGAGVDDIAEQFQIREIEPHLSSFAK